MTFIARIGKKLLNVLLKIYRMYTGRAGEYIKIHITETQKLKKIHYGETSRNLSQHGDTHSPHPPHTLSASILSPRRREVNPLPPKQQIYRGVTVSSVSRM